jgi:hypothetical protein
MYIKPQKVILDMQILLSSKFQNIIWGAQIPIKFICKLKYYKADQRNFSCVVL